MSSAKKDGEYSVLFVCTANRIRSVMAEALLRQRLESNGTIDAWQINSAGTWAGEGYPPMPYAIRAMAERGIDISAHRSKPIDQVRLTDFRLILVMERGHKEALMLEFPEVDERVQLISEMVASAYEVGDPVAGTLENHARTADLLDKLVGDGLERISQLARYDA